MSFYKGVGEDLLKERAEIDLIITNPTVIENRKRIKENFKFISGGDNQWFPGDLKQLREENRTPITVNLSLAIINNLSGIEIQSRRRFAFRADSNDQDTVKLANNLSYLGYNIQEVNSLPYLESLSFRDALICGIGTLSVRLVNDMIKVDYLHPFNFIPDPNDLSPQLTEMRKSLTFHYMSADYIKKKWPKKAQYINISDNNPSIVSPELMNRQSGYLLTNYNSASDRCVVIEYQKKEDQTAYSGIDREGRYFETFDEKKAEKIVESKNSIQEFIASRTIRSLWIEDVLLERGPSTPDIPNSKDLNVLPYIIGTDFTTGCFTGYLDCWKDIARECNYTLTKNYYLLNSSKIIIKGNPAPEIPIKDLKEQLRKPDGVVFMPPGCEFEVISNTPLAKSQIELIPNYINTMYEAAGISKERLGLQSNATSNLAIETRISQSITTQVPFFDAHEQRKKRIGQKILNIIQCSDLENMAVKIGEGEEIEYVLMNMIYKTENGEKFYNNINHIPLSVYIEEVPDYRSTFEERKANILAALNSPHFDLIAQSPLLMESLGIKNAQQISAQFMQAAQQMAMLSQPQAAIPTPSIPPSENSLAAAQLINGIQQ